MLAQSEHDPLASAILITTNTKLAEKLPAEINRQLINHPRLKIMFDCYHIYRESGDLVKNFADHADKIGHIQIAAAENRAEPFPGALDYSDILPEFKRLGYQGAFVCVYRTSSSTEGGLAWRDPFLKMESRE